MEHQSNELEKVVNEYLSSGKAYVLVGSREECARGDGLVGDCQTGLIDIIEDDYLATEVVRSLYERGVPIFESLQAATESLGLPEISPLNRNTM